MGIIMEDTVELLMGRELRVDSGTSKEVESELGIGHKLVPKSEREIGVGAGEAGDEVVLECPDGPLSSIAAVLSGWDQLVANTLFHKEILESLRAFIV